MGAQYNSGELASLLNIPEAKITRLYEDGHLSGSRDSITGYIVFDEGHVRQVMAQRLLKEISKKPKSIEQMVELSRISGKPIRLTLLSKRMEDGETAITYRAEVEGYLVSKVDCRTLEAGIDSPAEWLKVYEHRLSGKKDD